MCAERLLSSIIDTNDLNHDAQQVSVYLELDALPCGAACVAVGLEYPHIHSEWNHPSMSSQWGEGCGVEDTGSHFDPILVRVCVRCRPPPCQPLPPDATRELPAARCQRRAAWFSPLRSRSLSSGCAATAPCRCPVLFGAGAAARGDRR